MAKEIVRAKEYDLYIIEEMEKANFDKPWSFMTIGNDFANDFSNFMILKDGDEVLGYMNYWDIDNSLELNRIAINEDYRGDGNGEYLMGYLLSKAYEDDRDRIILEVAADNKAAIALYDKFDFKDV